MSPNRIFQIDMALGYLVWALCLATYLWPRLKRMDPVDAQRAVATFHSFRFFGLAVLLPGFAGPNLPQGFAVPVAFGDLATALLAILALITVRRRLLFWPLVWAFNLVGLFDLVLATANAVRLNLPSVAGQLGAAYAIPILYVPALVVTHLFAFRLLLQSLPQTVPTVPPLSAAPAK